MKQLFFILSLLLLFAFGVKTTNTATFSTASFLGDSQTANWAAANSFAQLISATGLSSIENKGLSGSSISNISEKQASIQSFTTRVAGMSSEVDLALIWGGTNDWHYSHYDTLTVQANLDSFRVGMHQLCDALVAKFPLKKILVVTPTQRNYTGEGSPIGQEGLIDYVDIMLQVCGEYSIQCIDAYRTSSIRTSNLSYLTTDGLHLADTFGFAVFGRWLGNEINKSALVSTIEINPLSQVCEGSVAGWSVNSEGDILVEGSVGSRVGLFFKDQFDTLEFTKNTAFSYWIAVGGIASSYVAVCNDYAYQLACNMTPNTYTNTQNMPTPAANFAGWTRIKIVQISGTYTFYAKTIEATNFALIYTFNSSTSGLSNLASVWVNNLLGFSRDLSSSGSGTIASDVKLNGQSILSYLD